MGAPGTTPGVWSASRYGANWGIEAIADDGSRSFVAGGARADDAHQIAASGALYDRLEQSQSRLRAKFIGKGTQGGSCSLCGSSWFADAEAHNPECQIVANDAALALARGEAPHV